MTPEDVRYGPDIGTEADYRLLGNVEGKRVIELGTGASAAAVALASAGAHVIALDSAAEALAGVQRRASDAEVRVEVHQGDLADLAFVRADSVDLVFSASALAGVDDLDRVFRSVHRVLRPDGPFVFSLPHPAAELAEGDPPVLRRSYFHSRRTVGGLFTALVRSGYRVDTLLEPEPLGASAMLPPSIVIRARKAGV